MKKSPVSPAKPARKALAFELRVIVDCPTAKPHSRKLAAHLRAAHALLKPALRELSLVIVDAHTMRKLHKQFMQDGSVTDVLTFPLDSDATGAVLSGEVIVCFDVAKSQAAARGHDVASELLLYALHGTLHLCGLDDRTQRDFAAMHAMEDQILSQLGAGPIFDPARIAIKFPPPPRSLKRSRQRHTANLPGAG